MLNHARNYSLASLFGVLLIYAFFSSTVEATDNAYVKPNAPVASFKDNSALNKAKNPETQDKAMPRKLSDRLIVDLQFNGDLPQAVVDQINHAIASKIYENSKSTIVISDAGYTIFYSDVNPLSKEPEVINVRRNWKPWFKANLKPGN